MSDGRRRALFALELLAGAAVFWFVARALARAWADYRAHSLALDVRWPLVAASAVVVLATYAVLVQTWRAVVRQWGERLGLVDAARIWSISGLTRYLPGKLWQIPVMGGMARSSGVSPVAAAGAAVVGTVVNIASGFVVALALGPRLLEAARPGAGRLAWLLLAIAVVGLLALPRMLPLASRALTRVTGRAIDLGAVPLRAVLVALPGNVLSWVLYGWAFRLFAESVLGAAQGPFVAWVAVWAISYVVGYIVLFLPAGIGARELAMVGALQAAGLATPAEAALLAVASRLWLTILEIAPGLVFLASGTLRRRAAQDHSTGAPR